MRYLLPTAPNECSYDTLVKMICQISTCLTTSTSVISTKLLLLSTPTLRECLWRKLEHFLLKLSSCVSVSDILLL